MHRRDVLSFGLAEIVFEAQNKLYSFLIKVVKTLPSRCTQLSNAEDQQWRDYVGTSPEKQCDKDTNFWLRLIAQPFRAR